MYLNFDYQNFFINYIKRIIFIFPKQYCYVFLIYITNSFFGKTLTSFCNHNKHLVHKKSTTITKQIFILFNVKKKHHNIKYLSKKNWKHDFLLFFLLPVPHQLAQALPPRKTSIQISKCRLEVHPLKTVKQISVTF